MLLECPFCEIATSLRLRFQTVLVVRVNGTLSTSPFLDPTHLTYNPSTVCDVFIDIPNVADVTPDADVIKLYSFVGFKIG